MEGHISRSGILYGSAEDIWADTENLYRDQLFETCQKLTQLDDEIWGKIILMERNKRVAKAYIRAQVVTVDGSTVGFDGFRIGFSAFDNPYRDRHVFETHAKIGQGVRLKMDQQGNILAKRMGNSAVIAQGASTPDNSCFSPEIIKSGGHLSHDKPVKVFDMNLFKNAIRHELQQPYPDRKKLLFKTVMGVSLVKSSSNPLNTPCWFMLVNLVAIDMINTQLPTVPPSMPAAYLSRRQGEMSDLMSMSSQSDLLNSLKGSGWGAPPSPNQFPLAPVYNVPPWSDVANSGEQMAQMANASALGFGPTPARPNSAYLDSRAAALLQWQRHQHLSGYMSECESASRGRVHRPRSEPNMRPLSRNWPPAVSTESLFGPVQLSREMPHANGSNFTLKPKTNSSKKLFKDFKESAYHPRDLKPSNWSSGSVSDFECSQTYDSSPYSSNTSATSNRPSSPSIVSEIEASESPSDSGYTEGSSSRSSREEISAAVVEVAPVQKTTKTSSKSRLAKPTSAPPEPPANTKVPKEPQKAKSPPVVKSVEPDKVKLRKSHGEQPPSHHHHPPTSVTVTKARQTVVKTMDVGLGSDSDSSDVDSDTNSVMRF